LSRGNAGFRGINGRHPDRANAARSGPRHLFHVPHFLPAPCYPAFATWQGCSSSCNQKTRKGRTAMTEIRDVYSRITGKIIADLEQGIFHRRPFWSQCWR
jgi:hypothetical protein